MSEFYCPHRDEKLTEAQCLINRQEAGDLSLCAGCMEYPGHEDTCHARPLPEPEPMPEPKQATIQPKAEQAKKKERTMQRPDREIPREQQDAFDAALKRIHEVTMTKTQVQLAEFLDIRQSSISDAKRRASIPSDWFMKILAKTNTNPQWLLHGDEHPRYLLPSQDGKAPAPALKYVGLEEASKEVVEELARKHLTSGDLMALIREDFGGWDMSVNFQNREPAGSGDGERVRQ